jgi:hypothetical protein
LRLQLQRSQHYPPIDAENVDIQESCLQDIANFFVPATVEEERMVAEKERVLREYRGGSANVQSILMQCGWTLENSAKILDLGRKVLIKR